MEVKNVVLYVAGTIEKCLPTGCVQLGEPVAEVWLYCALKENSELSHYIPTSEVQYDSQEVTRPRWS